MKHTGTTSTSTFLQGLFIQYLHKAVITSLGLQPTLTVSVHEGNIYHLYKGIYTVVHLLSSLLTSLNYKFIPPSLHVSLQSEILQPFLFTSVISGVLQSSLLTSLKSGTLRSFLLTSLLVCLWNVFLRCLYEDIPTITSIPSRPEMFVQGIHSKPEILLQNIRGFMILPKQVKPEAPKSWPPLHSSLHVYAKLF